MDNEDYLKHIAAQARPVAATNKFLTPAMIKLVIGAAIALVMIIVVGSILNSANQKTVGMYEKFYLRVTNLSATSGPLQTYMKSLKSSDLRSLTGALQTSLTTTARDLGGVLTDLKVDTANISADSKTAENGVMGAYTSELANAKLNGLLDRQFASSTILQISLLQSMESEIREKTSSTTLAGYVDKSTADLEALLTQFQNYSNSH